MVKKIVFILILILLVEGLTAGSVLSAFRWWSAPAIEAPKLPRESPSQSNYAAAKKTLTLLGADKKIVLDQKEIEGFAPLLLTPPLSAPADPLAAWVSQTLASQKSWTGELNFDTVKSLAVNEKQLGHYLLGLATSLNHAPADAQLLIENEKATKFVPQTEGKILDLAASRRVLKNALYSGAVEATLPVLLQQPKVTLGDLNDLGIKELLARGQSDFSGSSAARIQNIRTGAERYNGLILKPGEEFSFNKYLGPIDAAHGYLPELVIKPEGTVPEFGGGLCQVSSTAFRAAFFAGLPIQARRNHSYAVRYYEWISDDVPRAVGLDATIYPGAQDMKFINDTPGAILIWTKIEGRKLYFDFYGTWDGREVIVDGPHPYDRRPDGAVKSKVSRTVIYPDGNAKEVTFNSTYVSPTLYPKVYEYPKTPTTTPTEIPPPNQITN